MPTLSNNGRLRCSNVISVHGEVLLVSWVIIRESILVPECKQAQAPRSAEGGLDACGTLRGVSRPGSSMLANKETSAQVYRLFCKTWPGLGDQGKGLS